jgi:hypothetical protein
MCKHETVKQVRQVGWLSAKCASLKQGKCGRAIEMSCQCWRGFQLYAERDRGRKSGLCDTDLRNKETDASGRHQTRMRWQWSVCCCKRPA